ncbi:hypothetical protein EYF80_053339 [Liparis tanakae]|uniref:Uncharacterized protein n=1 Tax=Liparis tanakae TaxID=230148 RepID=A0A4Z2F5Y3_9TELE|nr:hypothetical protein EYF80_053339 [Liparis tanakae]
MTPPFVSTASTMTPPFVSTASTMTPPFVSTASTMTPPFVSTASTMTPPFVSTASIMTPPFVSTASIMTPPFVSTASALTPPFVSIYWILQLCEHYPAFPLRSAFRMAFRHRASTGPRAAGPGGGLVPGQCVAVPSAGPESSHGVMVMCRDLQGEPEQNRKVQAAIGWLASYLLKTRTSPDDDEEN